MLVMSRNVEYLELHGGELVKDAAHAVLNGRPCDLVLTLSGRLDGMTRHVIETHDVTQHAYCLVEWTEAIVW